MRASIFLHAESIELTSGSASVQRSATVIDTESYDYLLIQRDGRRICAITLPWLAADPLEETAPRVLGSYPAYVWRDQVNGMKRSVMAGVPFTTPKYPGARCELDQEPNKQLALIKAVSASLPDWVYLYVGPLNKLQQYPVVYHQGRELYFIENR